MVLFFHRCGSTQALRGLAERAKGVLRIRSRSLKPVARTISSSDSERLSSIRMRAASTRSCSTTLAGVRPVSSGKIRANSRAQIRLLRKLLDRQWLVEMFPRERDRLGHSIEAGIHLQQRGELRLPTGIHDEVLSDSTNTGQCPLLPSHFRHAKLAHEGGFLRMMSLHAGEHVAKKIESQ